MIAYPFYARIRLKLSWKKILRRDVEYLLWIYVWFYLAWGLNYSQKNFYERTGIPYTAYTPEIFNEFVDNYISKLNESYVLGQSGSIKVIREEAVRQYNLISDTRTRYTPSPTLRPRVKTMMFAPIDFDGGRDG